MSRDDNYIRLVSKLSQITEALEEISLAVSSKDDVQLWLTEFKSKTKRFNLEVQLIAMEKISQIIESEKLAGKDTEDIQEEVGRLHTAFKNFNDLCREDNGKKIEELCNIFEKELFPKETNKETLIEKVLADKDLLEKAKILLLPPFPKVVSRAWKRPMGALSEGYIELLEKLIKEFQTTKESWRKDVRGRDILFPIVSASALLGYPAEEEFIEEAGQENEEINDQDEEDKEGEGNEVEFADPDEEDEDQSKGLSKTEISQFLRTIKFLGFEVAEDKGEKYIIPLSDYFELFRKYDIIKPIKKKNDDFEPDFLYTPNIDHFIAIYYSELSQNRDLIFVDLIFWISHVFSTIIFLGNINLVLDKKSKFYHFIFEPIVIARFFVELTMLCGSALGGYEWISKGTKMVVDYGDNLKTDFIQKLAPHFEYLTNKEKFQELTNLGIDKEDEDEDGDAYFDKWVRGEI